ncbi:MAG: endonuclease I [Planctomycetota bacterium]|jgi:endonuclease I
MLHTSVHTTRFGRGSVIRLLGHVLALALIAVPFASSMDALQGPPPGYYNGVDTSSAAALRATLHPIIDDHAYFPYTSTVTDTWDVLELAQQDPNNSAHILDVYRNASYLKQGGGNSLYNREHTWPKSYGFPDDDGQNLPYTDCHLLWLSDDGYNSSRSNKPFRDCHPGCAELTTDANNGGGGGSGTYSGNSNWSEGSFTQGTWQVWSGRKGDVARAILYADVRYEGGNHGSLGWSEPDLVVTDSEALIDASNTGVNESTAYMGILSVLLQWHAEDPPDAEEESRNDVVYTFQGNRNPFVDNPTWVDILWGGGPPPASGEVWINEFHYDNAGSDLAEFVEVAGSAGTDLSGWSIFGYNGAGGIVYTTLNLSGQIPDQGNCLGAVSFNLTGMQNGSPDGLALVDPFNQVQEFLSYEGTFLATDGPAIGLSSTDIGVAESSTTPLAHSLQLGGSGSVGSEFTWQAEAASTSGAVNGAQTFEDACIPMATVYGSGINPAGSMTVVSGLPQTGTTLTIGLNNPIGTQAGGAPTLMFFSLSPNPNYPAGTPIPGFGMSGVGELLINLVAPDPVLSQFGPNWDGTNPSLIDIAIPSDGSLIGTTIYGQGVIWDPFAVFGVRFGLTDAVEIPVF